MEKHVPKIIGAWLAGTYDRDRAVARAANDGLRSFLDTEEKLLSLWRKCQSQIIEYSQRAIEETPQTLSDERTVSVDDSEAKYQRVIGTSLSLVVNLLAKLSTEDTAKYQDSYDSLLAANKGLWGLVASQDSFVRKTTSQLLVICLEKQKRLIEADLELISASFITEGLRATQSGSSLQLVQALGHLTVQYPEVWTTSYKSKKTPISRLRLFLQRGSQSGPQEYWQAVIGLLLRLPSGVLPTDIAGAQELLKAMHDGIAQREEPRANSAAAWSGYLALAAHLVKISPDAKKSGVLLSMSVYPLFEQYFLPSSEHSRWSVGLQPATTISKAYNLCAASEEPDTIRLLAGEWNRLAEKLITTMLTSLPEQSKDYNKSQAAVISEAQRWFSLEAEVLKRTPTHVVDFVETTTKIVKHAQESLSNRKGKPYGAAGVLEAAFKFTPSVMRAAPPIMASTEEFLQQQLPVLALSPSGPYLIASLHSVHSIVGQDDGFARIWNSTLQSLLDSPETAEKRIAVQALMSDDAGPSMAREDSSLQSYLLSVAMQATQGSVGYWPFFEYAIGMELFTKESLSSLVDNLLQHLEVDDSTVRGTLKALQTLSQKKPDLLKSGSKSHVAILRKLLALTESLDGECRTRATALKIAIDSSNNLGQPSMEGQMPIVRILQDNLRDAGSQSLR